VTAIAIASFFTLTVGKVVAADTSNIVENILAATAFSNIYVNPSESGISIANILEKHE